ncbi:MAG: hypothetical protein GQ525_00055, partial [Draconibacterium sp.]|nr:hypothetical protein [Draconibacterium sp.]
ETITRVYRVTDMCGNSRDATETWIIYDETPPEVQVRIPDINDGGCVIPDPLESYLAFRLLGGEYIEFCGDIRMTHLIDTLADPSNPNVWHRVYRFFDDCDNYADYVQKITIDVTIPVFAQLGPFCQNTGAYELPTTSDDVNRITGTWSPAVIETSVAGIITYTFTPEDGQCAAEINMDIEVTPEIILSDTHINIGYSTLPIGSINLTVSGGTGLLNYSWSNGASTRDINTLIAGVYDVQVTDAIGCEAILTVIITAIVPETDIICLDDIYVECVTEVPAEFNYYKEFTDAGGLATSDCGIDTSTFVWVNDSSDFNSCPETIYRTYQVLDNCLTVLSCTHKIIIDDVTPPEITCPPNGEAVCLSNLIHDFATIEEFIAAGGSVSDNCALDSSSFAFSTTIVKTINSTEMTTVYSIKDLCGNENSCEHKFILTDTIPPNAICNSITVQLDEFGNYILTEIDIQNISAGSNDNCTAEEDLIIDVEIVEFDCDDVEEGVQVTIVVTDEAGNSENCTAIITVVDSTPPVALCRDIIIYLDEYGIATIDVTNIDDGSYDNCLLDTMYISKDTFDCSNVGNNPVELVVIDAATNRDSCIANVIVVDTIPPDVIARDITIQLDANAQYTLTTAELVVGSYDVCGVDTIYLDQYILDCADIPTTYIVVTAKDVNGNVGRDTAEITVYGNIPPNVLPDSAVTVMNVAIPINIVDNDYDLKTEIDFSTLSLFKAPDNGIVEFEINQLTNKRTGFIVYTPNPGFVGKDILTYSVCDDAIPCEEMCGEAFVYITVLEPNNPPIAVDDYFTTTCASPTGNILINDSDPDGNEITLNTTPVLQPTHGEVTIYANGDFDYIANINYIGLDSFVYQICDDGLPSMCDQATVYITVEPDKDCDGVPDWEDIDDDNDGILDVVEGLIDYDGDGLSDNGGEVDSDLDGIPDYLDIDSDNDGIVDNEEGQAEGTYIYPTGYDTNNNGWDDAYDPEDGGYEFEPADTDDDSIPDYLDLDSENDNVYDFIEGHDINADGIPDVVRIFVDSDNDGLDDIYDIVFGWNDPNDPFNSTGSNSPLQDFDGDGTRDWRDTNDEDDEYLTIDEDLNNDGDYSNDDLDLDGFPEYLDKTLDCELFVPEGFSPNGDGVHDFFQVLCIQRYPNAIMMIFNRNGDLLFEKDHYGNLDFWGSHEDAWWWGTTENKWTIFNTGGLPAGNYVYVLQLGNGKVEKGTVMVNY